MKPRIDPESLTTSVDEILTLIAACRLYEPMPRLIRHLELITPANEARAAARLATLALRPEQEQIGHQLTEWWLTNLAADQSRPADLALAEILHALELGKAPPAVRPRLHAELRSTLERALQIDPDASILLLKLPDMIRRPSLLPDTRLTVFAAVVQQSERLMDTYPHGTRQQIHLLAKAAHTQWKEKTYATTAPPSPSEAMQIIALASTNTDEAALRAHLLLQDTEGPQARLDLLDHLNLEAARSLPAQELVHFRTNLHSHIMFMPELAQPSRGLLIDAFNDAAKTPDERAQLAQDIRPQLFADGPLNSFLLAAMEKPKTVPALPPPASPGVFKRVHTWWQRSFGAPGPA